MDLIDCDNSDDGKLIDGKIAMHTTHFQMLLSGRRVGDFYNAYAYANSVGMASLNNSINFVENGDPWSNWCSRRPGDSDDLEPGIMHQLFMILMLTGGDLTVNLKSTTSGHVPLIYALGCDYFPVCAKIMLTDPKVRIDCSSHQDSPLTMSLRKGHIGLASQILKRAQNINFQDADGNTALHNICIISDLALLHEIIDIYLLDLDLSLVNPYKLTAEGILREKVHATPSANKTQNIQIMLGIILTATKWKIIYQKKRLNLIQNIFPHPLTSIILNFISITK